MHRKGVGNSLVEMLSGVVRLELIAGVGWCSVADGRVCPKLCHLWLVVMSARSRAD